MTEEGLRAHLLGIFETLNDRWDGVMCDQLALMADGHDPDGAAMQAVAKAARELGEVRDDLAELMVDAGWHLQWREPLRLVAVDGETIAP